MRKISSTKGFTLVETMVSLALVGMVILILMSVESLFSKEKSKLTSRMDSNVDTLLGERVLYLDFRGVAPSFNTLKLKDDRGNLFFDYYFDIPANMLGAGRGDRVFTLEAGRNVFYLMTQDTEAGGLLNFDPVSAYEIGPIPADFNRAATVTFSSVNKNNWISSQRPQFWQKNKLLLFDTNVYVRKTEPLDMTEAPSIPVFLGSVNVATNQVVSTTLSTYLSSPSTSVDRFLRELQPRGGGQPFVKVRAVRFYRYYLQAYRDDRVMGTPARLMRDEFVDGNFANPQMLSDRVKAVKFSRESVMNKVVKFSIEKLEAKSATSNPQGAQ